MKKFAWILAALLLALCLTAAMAEDKPEAFPLLVPHEDVEAGHAELYAKLIDAYNQQISRESYTLYLKLQDPAYASIRYATDIRELTMHQPSAIAFHGVPAEEWNSVSKTVMTFLNYTNTVGQMISAGSLNAPMITNSIKPNDGATSGSMSIKIATGLIGEIKDQKGATLMQIGSFSLQDENGAVFCHDEYVEEVYLCCTIYESDGYYFTITNDLTLMGDLMTAFMQ